MEKHICCFEIVASTGRVLPLIAPDPRFAARWVQEIRRAAQVPIARQIVYSFILRWRAVQAARRRRALYATCWDAIGRLGIPFHLGFLHKRQVRRKRLAGSRSSSSSSSSSLSSLSEEGDGASGSGSGLRALGSYGDSTTGAMAGEDHSTTRSRNGQAQASDRSSLAARGFERIYVLGVQALRAAQGTHRDAVAAFRPGASITTPPMASDVAFNSHATTRVYSLRHAGAHHTQAGGGDATAISSGAGTSPADDAAADMLVVASAHTGDREKFSHSESSRLLEDASPGAPGRIRTVRVQLDDKNDSDGEADGATAALKIAS